MDEDQPPQLELIQEPKPRTSSEVAPAWHTAVLLAAIVAISVTGALSLTPVHAASRRLVTYGLSAAMELAMLGWVVFGLKLRGTSLRALLGSVRFDLRAILQDMTVAMVFWVVSLTVLGSLGIFWTRVETAVAHNGPSNQTGQSVAGDAAQRRVARELAQLAPSNDEEVAAWVLLCVLAGTVEEIVFRGYLQRQFTAWMHGETVWGVILSAVAFGSAHGYQGARNMVLLAVFGVLFSVLALYRHSLRAGMFAHSWHDLIAGLALAALRSHHVL